MSLEDSNKEILPFVSYEINIDNPLALKKKKSEKEQVIEPIIDLNYDNSKKDLIIQEKANQVGNNNHNDVNEETQSKKNELNQENSNKEPDNIEISKKEEVPGRVEMSEKIKEKPKIEEVKIEEKIEEKKVEKVEKKAIIKDENIVKGLKQIENIKIKNGQKKEEKNKNKKEQINIKKKIKNEKNDIEKKELKRKNL